MQSIKSHPAPGSTLHGEFLGLDFSCLVLYFYQLIFIESLLKTFIFVRGMLRGGNNSPCSSAPHISLNEAI